MYKTGDRHVELLTASVRNLDHLLYALYFESDIITAPLKVLQAWKDADLKIHSEDFVYDTKDLKEIQYRDLNLSADWRSFNLHDPLVESGIEGFAADWNKLISDK